MLHYAHKVLDRVCEQAVRKEDAVHLKRHSYACQTTLFGNAGLVASHVKPQVFGNAGLVVHEHVSRVKTETHIYIYIYIYVYIYIYIYIYIYVHIYIYIYVVR